MIKVKENYSEAITNEQVGLKLKIEIDKELQSSDVIEVDFDGVLTMTTNCAKQIFGEMYEKMGAEQFYRRIIMIAANEDIQLSITQGIANRNRAKIT